VTCTRLPGYLRDLGINGILGLWRFDGWSDFGVSAECVYKKPHRGPNHGLRLFNPMSACLWCACAVCDGFGFARNTATTFDVFYWLQVTNFDGLLNSAPNGPD